MTCRYARCAPSLLEFLLLGWMLDEFSLWAVAKHCQMAARDHASLARHRAALTAFSTACQVLCFQGCRWDPDAVNYVFFRNNIFHPDRLPPVQARSVFVEYLFCCQCILLSFSSFLFVHQISDPACSAYACQCSWQSVSALKEISRSGYVCFCRKKAETLDVNKH